MQNAVMPQSVKALALATCLFLPVAGTAAQAAEAPKVVVSIKPLYGVVASVMDGVGAPKLTLDGFSSPHDFSMQPSQAQMLADADLVVWAGPVVEAFLQKPLANSDAPVLTMIEQNGMTLYPIRNSGIWEHDHDHGEHDEHGHDEHTEHDDHGHDEHGHEEHAEHDDHGHDDHGHDEHAEHDDHGHDENSEDELADGHLWLDPSNAAALATAVAAKLGEIDPDHAAAYKSNAAAFGETIAATKQALAERLQPVQGKPYIVFHDAYQYFEKAFSLSGAGAVTIEPHIRPGAATLAELQEAVQERDVVCVFGEPQFPPASVETIAAGTTANYGTLDPLGVETSASPQSYVELMNNLADALVGCLSQQG